MVNFITSKVKTKVVGDCSGGGQQGWYDGQLRLTAQLMDERKDVGK